MGDIAKYHVYQKLYYVHNFCHRDFKPKISLNLIRDIKEIFGLCSKFSVMPIYFQKLLFNIFLLYFLVLYIHFLLNANQCYVY